MNLKFLRFLLQLGKKLSLTLLILLCIPVSMVRAQIEPDGSIPTNVEELRDLLMEISGGEVSGDNLFHSFDEFSVPEGAEAVFQNADSIENIFARVTGDSASLIDGMLSTQGDANLFLMNPNGIVFGENAAVNVGGSFIGTTADGILFEDGNEFAATDDGSDPVLSVEVPIGLGFGSNPQTGNITVNGDGSQITGASPTSPTSVESNNPGLGVSSGNTIGLVGSGVTVDGRTLTAEGGNIELGSVDNGVVDIQPIEDGFAFNYDNVGYQDIDLANQAVLDVSGEDVGTINLTGDNITFADGSLALLTNLGDSTSDGININAIENFTLTGAANDGNYSSAIRSEAFGTGEGAGVNVSTGNLIVRNAGIISGITYTDASSGNLKIEATGSIELLENSGINPTRQTNRTGGLGSTTYGSGNAGDVQVSTDKLRIIDGSTIGSPTVGIGNGGDISVKANSISLTGTNQSESAISGILAASASSGNAGNVNVDTVKLTVAEGATLNSSSIANGDAGNVNINASDSVEVTGQSQNPDEPRASDISSSVSIPNEAFQQELGLDSEVRGQAGNLNLNTPFLSINNRGEVSVRNEGTGAGGILSITTDEINLDEFGSITAATVSGQGGNITLDTDNLQIDNNSTITAEAETQGDGGNININASNIFAKKSSAVRKRMLPVPC